MMRSTVLSLPFQLVLPAFAYPLFIVRVNLPEEPNSLLTNRPNKLVSHYPELKRLARDNHSSLLGPFTSYEENAVLLNTAPEP